MRYLLENDRIEEIKASARYLFPLRKYKVPSILQKEYQLLEESRLVHLKLEHPSADSSRSN